MKTISRSALVAFLALAASACTASSPTPPPATAGNPAAAPGAPVAYGAPNAQGVQGAPGIVGTSPANALVSPLGIAPANGTAQPIDPTLAGAAGALLDRFAGSLAPGMSREGAPIAANFQTGQTMEQIIPLQTGRCYTVVAAGPTVQSWDLSLILVTNPVPLQPVLAHETRNGTPAALAGSGNCFKWNFLPAQARVVVRVDQGGGVAVAQVYGK
ncbi:MAG TPA: hypothetical protein VGG39_37275 [Polyangiaceae bacterium]